MKTIAKITAAVACVASPTFADDIGSLEAGLGISTLGPTISAGYKVSEKMVVRGLYSTGLSRSATTEVNGIKYDVKGAVGGFGILADYYPFAGNFFISGGIISSNSGIDLTASIANKTVGEALNQTGELKGRSEFKNQTAPTFALGYRLDLSDSFSLRSELGAMATGGASLTASSATISQEAIDRELRDVEDAMTQVSMFPYISLTASYRF